MVSLLFQNQLNIDRHRAYQYYSVPPKTGLNLEQNNIDLMRMYQVIIFNISSQLLKIELISYHFSPEIEAITVIKSIAHIIQKCNRYQVD